MRLWSILEKNLVLQAAIDATESLALPHWFTAIAVRTVGKERHVYAPFGFDDLFSITARANKRQITKNIYDTKVQRWMEHWPSLRVIPWSGDCDQSRLHYEDTMSDSDRLEEEQFTYKVTKDGKLFVYWHGKEVRTYTGLKAASIIEELNSTSSTRDTQFALARVTGNFKRGNEKLAKGRMR